jgi:hypothetical protein
LADPNEAVAQYVLKLLREPNAACRSANGIAI